ncbi:MAG: glycoside hydrolase [Porphyromonadaceae bacterium CG2_30_38_12]|nr:MAG: glycoside hydrolase [Porphyromonadaceae bacterium CG2_30_38_12]
MSHKKTLLLQLLLFFCYVNSSFAQPTFQRNILLDNDWTFHRGGCVGAQFVLYNDSAWRKISLPHDWSIEDLDGKNSPFDKNATAQQSTGFTVGGVGWYRKQLEIPETYKGKRIILRFDGVYNNSEVFINGQLAAKQPFGYSTFEVDITSKINYSEKNTIAVKVQNEGENSRWYTGSGIYRHVWLDVVDSVRMARYGSYITTPNVSANEAFVNLKSSIVNDGSVSAVVKLISTIRNERGIAVANSESTMTVQPNSNNTFSTDIKVVSPSLWNLDSPTLYTAVNEVYYKDILVDKTETKFGIRTISFDAKNGFQLNGKSIKLKGGCVHHDNGPLGAKAYDRAEERKVEILKANGYNAIRTSHNPPSTAFLDACDRLGMLVIDEAFDCWQTGKNPLDYHLFFDKWWQKDLETMLLRDRNHPSIIMWSIGNEIPEIDKPEVVKTAIMLKDFVKTLDTTRPVTAGVHGLNGNNTPKDAFVDALDVAGYNYAPEKYLKDHVRKPNRVMFASESAAFTAFDYWMGVIDNPHVIGDFVWTSWDYIGEASIGWRGFNPDEKLYPWSLAYCGDIDICGWKRPQSYYRDALWTKNAVSLFVKPPTASFPINEKKEGWSQWNWYDAVADWNWNGYEGKPLEVSVYSSCDQVELFLNGKSLGKKPTNRSTKFTAIFTVPYQAGVLKAVGFAGKKMVSSTELKTAGEVANIRLTADRTEIAADGQDLSYITVDLVDAYSVRNPKAENLIHFEIEGAGEIVGVGNANPVSLESYQLPQRKAWQGKCMVIVKSKKQVGKITLNANLEGKIKAFTTIYTKPF